MATMNINNNEVFFTLNGRAYTRQEAEKVFTEDIVPQTSRVTRGRAAARAAKKAAALAAYLSIRLGCTFNAAYAASMKGGTREAAEKLLNSWADRAWSAPRRTAAKNREVRAALLIGIGTADAAEEALKQERLLAEKASAALAGKRHYESIMARNAIAPRKEAKVRSDRSASKAAREERAEMAWAQYHAACAKADAGKCQRVWASARNLPVYWEKGDKDVKSESKMSNGIDLQLFAAAVEPMDNNILELAMFALDCTANKVEQLRINGKLIEVVSREAEWLSDYLYEDNSGELKQRYDAACKLHAVLVSGGVSEFNGDCSHESATVGSMLDVISSMFDPEANRRGINGIDWVDDSRLIEADDIIDINGDETEEVSEGGNVMFKFDLQLFADGHMASKSYVRSLKGSDKNAMAYSLKVLPDKDSDGIFVILGREMAEVTPLNRHLIVENSVMTDLRGCDVNVKRMFQGYATMDLSAVVSSSNDRIRNAGATLAESDILIGKYNNETVVCVLDDGFDEMIVISKKTKKGGNRYTVPVSAAIDNNGKTKSGWTRFGEYKLFSPSKGRQSKFDLFSDEHFEDVLDKATYGEWSKVKGLSCTIKEVAEEVTRLGSKSCRMGTDQLVENITIVLGKDNSSDGAGLIANVGIKNGYLVQCRPYTAKGAALVVANKTMEIVESRYNTVTWDKKNLTKHQEEILDILLNKQKQRVSGKSIEKIAAELGINAIKLVGNPEKGTQVFGDLNFWKDMWDYKRDSALNILDIANFTGSDFKKAHTSGQMMKILMRAVNDSNDKNLVMDAKRFLAKTIKDEVAKKILDVSAKKFDGTELLNPSYMSGAVKSLNSESWTSDPEVYKNVITDKINSIRETFQKDRYGINGYSAMVTVDIAHFIGDMASSLLTHEVNGKFSLLKHEVNAKGEVTMFEVFDPVANRYLAKNPGAGRYGAVVKYPSMGTKEACIIRFASEDEMMQRIDETDFTADVKSALKDEVANFKEGAIMVPNSLDVLAMILAGFDLDGDHLEVILPSANGMDTPTLLRRANFVPVAVKIAQPKPAKVQAEHAFTCADWARYSYEIIKSGNKSVGVVTNNFRLFTDGLLQDMNTPNIHKFYVELFVAIGATRGNRDYQSVIPCVGGVFQCDEKSMDRFINAIKNINLDKVDNVIAMLDDMDKLGRFCQELTIDAQKKFYKVPCDWMDNLVGFSLFALEYGLIFKAVTAKGDFGDDYIAGVELQQNEAYIMNGGKVILAANVISDKQRVVIADAFALHRVYAANEAINCFNMLLHDYENSRAVYRANQGKRDNRLAAIYRHLNVEGMAQVTRAARSMYTIGKIYGENISVANEALKKLNVPMKIKAKIDQDIKKGIAADYNTHVEAISNEIRRICADNKMDTLLVSEALTLDGVLNRSGIASRILREERLINLIEASETKEFSAVLHAPVALKKWLTGTCAETVQIAGGAFYNVGCGEFFGVDIKSDLVDGIYKLFTNNKGELCVSRPSREFVDMSGIMVDHDMRVIGQSVVADDASSIIALDKALNVGEEYSVSGTTQNHKYSLVDVNNNELVRLYFGSTDKHIGTSKEPTILSKSYRGFSGKLVAKTISLTPSGSYTTVDENGKKSEKFYYNYVIVLHR